MPGPPPPLDYAAYEVARSAPWQQLGPMGIGWSDSLGSLKDAYAAGIRLAVTVHYPSTAPPDALDSIGVTAGGITRDMAPTNAQYVAKLNRAWAAAEMWGTLPGMVAALEQAGLANVAVWESAWILAYGDTAWSDGLAAYYFTITCSLPMPWNSYPLADGTWGDGDVTKTWDDGGVWATGIPDSWRQQLKALITREKPEHARCAAVIVNLNTGGWLYDVGAGAVFDGPGATTWGGGAGSPTTLTINMDC